MNRPSPHRHEFFGADISPAGTALGGLREEWREPHCQFLGLPFCRRPQPEVLRLVLEHGDGAYGYVVTPNAHHVFAVHEQPARLLPVYRDAWLSLCDSQIVRILAKLDGIALPLVTGSNLVAALLSTLNSRNHPSAPPRLLVVGPSPAAASALSALYPNVMLDVLPAPARLATDAELRLNVAQDCLERAWDILLLCVGCPAQELIARQIGELGRKTGVALCVGAAIDFLIGARVRAPLWMQKTGLEWAWRLVREPGRLWRRYLIESPKILRIFFRHRSV